MRSLFAGRASFPTGGEVKVQTSSGTRYAAFLPGVIIETSVDGSRVAFIDEIDITEGLVVRLGEARSLQKRLPQA